MNYNNVVPPTNNGLTPNLPRNKKSIIGSKLANVVDDQIMPMSNFVLHNSKKLLHLGYGLISLFSWLTSRIKSFHPFLNFKCWASHNTLFTSTTKRCHIVFTIIYFENKQLQTFLGKQNSPILD
jgi:hypothetical protein